MLADTLCCAKTSANFCLDLGCRTFARKHECRRRTGQRASQYERGQAVTWNRSRRETLMVKGLFRAYGLGCRVWGLYDGRKLGLSPVTCGFELLRHFLHPGDVVGKH